MGNWNRHFVRVGSDGNVDMFDTTGFQFMSYSTTNKLLTFVSDISSAVDYTQLLIGGGVTTSIPNNGGAPSLTVNNFANIPAIRGMANGIAKSGSGFNVKVQIPDSLTMNGFAGIQGTPDLRTGVTAADASPITIFSSTQSGTRYEVKARILATSGSSATYTISWTEGGAAQKVALTITAVDTEVHDNFVIAPDANTNITAQITALTSSTVNVDAIVSVLG